MKTKFNLADTTLYRWRYPIGYSLLGLVLIATLVVAGFYIPGTFSEAELNSVVNSSKLTGQNLFQFTPLNLPYHLLQHASLSIFGAGLIGIKLPSLLLGFVAAIALTFLLRRWYTPAISVLATIIIVTTGQFIFLSQQGSPDIMLLFWPIVILLAATKAVQKSRWRHFWMVVCLVAISLSLYTPLGIFVIIALISAVILHPHLRYLLRKVDIKSFIVGTLIAVVLLIPLALQLLRDPTLVMHVVGLPESFPNIGNSLMILGNQYFGFMSLGSSSMMLPVFGLPSMMLILYGLYLTIKRVALVQSYVVLIWLILLLPALIMSPYHTSIMLVPLTLLLAAGLDKILSSWYRTFPFNPYARVAGLIPIAVLVSAMVMFGLERYGYAYRYTPSIVNSLSSDILLIPDDLPLVVSEPELPIYRSISKYNRDLEVARTPPAGQDYAATRAARSQLTVPSSIVVSTRSSEADRFYIYHN